MILASPDVFRQKIEDHMQYPWPIDILETIGKIKQMIGSMVVLELDEGKEIIVGETTLAISYAVDIGEGETVIKRAYLLIIEDLGANRYGVSAQVPFTLDPMSEFYAPIICNICNYNSFISIFAGSVYRAWLLYMLPDNLIFTYLPIGEWDPDFGQEPYRGAYTTPTGTSTSGGPLITSLQSPLPYQPFAIFISGEENIHADWCYNYTRFATLNREQVDSHALVTAAWVGTRTFLSGYWSNWVPTYQISGGVCDWEITRRADYGNILVSDLMVTGGYGNTLTISGQDLTQDYSGNIIYTSSGLESEIIRNTINTITFDDVWNNDYIGNNAFIFPLLETFIAGRWSDYILRAPVLSYDPDFSGTIAAMAASIEQEGTEYNFEPFANTIANALVDYFRESMNLNYVASEACFAAIPDRLEGEVLNLEGKATGAITELQI